MCAHCPGFKGYPDPCVAQVQWDQVDCPQKYSTICGVCPAMRRQMWINRAQPASIRAPMVPDPCGKVLTGVQRGGRPVAILALMPTALRCSGTVLFLLDFAVVLFWIMDAAGTGRGESGRISFSRLGDCHRHTGGPSGPKVSRATRYTSVSTANNSRDAANQITENKANCMITSLPRA